MIKVTLDKKYLWPFRLIMGLLAIPYLLDIFSSLETGIAQSRGTTAARTEDSLSFYIFLSKDLIFSLVLLWLASFGAEEKQKND